MASNPPHDLVLTPLTGKGFALRAWLVQYHLLLVAIDPFTNEGAWALPVALRVLQTFEQSDCRVGIVLSGADADEARQFLGPHARTILAFPDRDRTITKALGFTRVPAVVHLDMDGKVVSSAEDWNPITWQEVTDELARQMRWTGPVLPDPRDPGSFIGTPALG